MSSICGGYLQGALGADALRRARHEGSILARLEGLKGVPQLIPGLARAGQISSLAQAKKLRLVSALSPTLPLQLRGDQVRLRQILLNLVGNALKFSSRGQVTVRA